jgi:hypothetical protein
MIRQKRAKSTLYAVPFSARSSSSMRRSLGMLGRVFIVHIHGESEQHFRFGGHKGLPLRCDLFGMGALEG